MSLPKKAIAEDHDLELRANRTTERLAKHRWHWTLDESNPDRVTINAYAKAVGRSFPSVARMVKGYAEFVGDSARAITLNDAIELANLGEERRAVTEAVADATGLSLATLRAGQHRAEINEVLSTAHERAERKGTTVEEEVPVVAKQRAKMREADKKRTATRKAKHGFRYIEIEGHLAAAQRRLSQALSTAQDVAWVDEEIELLTDSLGKIRAVLNLIDMRIAGETDVNWDAELASLTKET